MTPLDIKLKQKTLLDYGKIIEETDNELLTLELSDYARKKFKEMIKDSIIRARELRKELLDYGLVQFGTIFTDFDAVYIHSDLGFIPFKMNYDQNMCSC